MQFNSIFDKINNSKDFPRIPEQVSMIFSILQDPMNLDLNTLYLHLNKLPKLETALLDFLNKGFFKFHTKVSTIPEVVKALGIQNLRSFIILSCIKSLIPDNFGRSTLFQRHLYWEHSIGVSLTCGILSEKMKINDPYYFIPFGLIHDLGVVLLDRCAPEETDAILKMAARDINILEAEKQILGGITHADIGAWLCKKWQLPLDFSVMIEYHHRPSEAVIFQPQIAILALADSLCKKYFEKMQETSLSLLDKMFIEKQTDMEISKLKDIMTILPKLIAQNKRFFDILYAAQSVLPEIGKKRIT